jgi:hypothetical protein
VFGSISRHIKSVLWYFLPSKVGSDRSRKGWYKKMMALSSARWRKRKCPTAGNIQNYSNNVIRKA